jgi:Fe-S-cluster-containing hydrogenase component 2
MIYVDLEKCTGCGICLEACPVEAISMVDGKAVIVADDCLACEACARICPQEAIIDSQLSIIPAHASGGSIHQPASTK